MNKFTKQHQESFIFYTGIFFGVCQDKNLNYKEEVNKLKDCDFESLGIGNISFWQEEGFKEEEVRKAYLEVVCDMLDRLIVS